MSHVPKRPGLRGPLERLTRWTTEGCKKPLESGSASSSGIAGARGPSMDDLAILDRRQIDASTIRGDGSNTFPGLVTDILWRWKGVRAGECILMVSFDSQTSQRLNENLYGSLGFRDTDGVVYSLTIVREEPPST